MTSRATRMALILATLISGLLAGFNVDRAFVAMPAWSEVGAVAWAEFSRRADLGNGLILYPLEAIGGALLTLAAAIGVHFDRSAARLAAVSLYAAVVLVAGGLAFTALAAPIMLGVRGVSDPAALRNAFEGFRYWGDWRALCQVLAFPAQLAALAMLLRGDEAKRP
jgi:hypothetical protein